MHICCTPRVAWSSQHDNACSCPLGRRPWANGKFAITLTPKASMGLVCRQVPPSTHPVSWRNKPGPTSFSLLLEKAPADIDHGLVGTRLLYRCSCVVLASSSRPKSIRCLQLFFLEPRSIVKRLLHRYGPLLRRRWAPPGNTRRYSESKAILESAKSVSTASGGGSSGQAAKWVPPSRGVGSWTTWRSWLSRRKAEKPPIFISTNAQHQLVQGKGKDEHPCPGHAWSGFSAAEASNTSTMYIVLHAYKTRRRRHGHGWVTSRGL